MSASSRAISGTPSNVLPVDARRSRRSPCRGRRRATARCRRSARTAARAGRATWWQDAHIGLAACCTNCSRAVLLRSSGLNIATISGDGGFDARHRMRSSTNLPRRTGSVRSSFAIVASSAACVSSPTRLLRVERRRASQSVDRGRRDAVELGERPVRVGVVGQQQVRERAACSRTGSCAGTGPSPSPCSRRAAG